MAIGEMEKIQILLCEHRMLRDEIIARMAHVHQLIAIGVSALALLIGLGALASPKFWIALGLVASVLAVAFWIWLRDIKKAGARIREIELDVNERVGEDLLIWENLWGGGVTGFIGRAKPFPRSHLAKLQKYPRTFRGQVTST
jgi:hypothetical protein